MLRIANSTKSALIIATAVSFILTAPWALELPSNQRMLQSHKMFVTPPAGIIILGGGLSTYLEAERVRGPVKGPGERIAAGIQLAKQYPQAILLHTGIEDPPGARPVLERGGVPAARIVIEDMSRNTAENARFSAQLLHPRPEDRWILVTSEAHMSRALACYQAAGFDVEPFPVDKASTSARDLGGAWREVIGAIGYQLLGRCKRD